MIEEGKFGPEEAICLATIAISAKAFYTSPAAIEKIVGTSGWYLTLISAATAALEFTFIYLLLRRFPDKNIMEIYDITLGRLIGFIFNLILFAWLIFTAAIDLREYIEVLKTFTMPLSPIKYTIGLFIVSIFVFSILGLESIARVAKLFAYPLLTGFIAVLILAGKNYNIGRIFPIFGYGIGTTIYHGILRSSAYGEIILLAVIASSLQGSSHIKKAGFISLLLGGLIISASILAFTLSFPYAVGQELTAPMYVMSTLISFGRFFKRLEAIFLFIWDISSLIEITALFYAALMVYCYIFRISDKRAILYPLSIIFCSIVVIPNGIIEIATIYIQVSREQGWVFYYIPPIIALIAAVLRKKTGVVKDA